MGFIEWVSIGIYSLILTRMEDLKLIDTHFQLHHTQDANNQQREQYKV